MNRYTALLLGIAFLLLSQSLPAQPKRIGYNNQQLYLSGLNIAWINYDNDVGSSIPTDTVEFTNIFQQVHSAGGNIVRWWIHNDGTITPQFSTADSSVIGPGPHTLSDMKKILDLAWENGIGVDVCLWAFNMLNTSNSPFVLARNKKLLNDTNYTRAYINNCLVPMVTSLKGHPAIVAWEIFNEPEGMASEFNGFGGQQLVPMSVIQRFINLCAGAIHRTDPQAKVTSGANNFYSLTDNPFAKIAPLPKMSTAAQSQLVEFYKNKYHASLMADEILARWERIANNNAVQQNYYRDDRLITAGGDPVGVLDFYSVHYYASSSYNTLPISPFHHMAVTWGLGKPIVVAEFAMESTYSSNPPGIPKSALYDTLYQIGYAGSLAWSWTDTLFSNRSDMLANMQSIWKKHKADIAVNKTVYDWPSVTITSPVTGTSYPDSTNMSFITVVVDTLPITSVSYYRDSIMIGTVTLPVTKSNDTSIYYFRWNNILPGSYNIKAIATNSMGHSKVTSLLIISINKPPMMRLEAETAALGSGMTVKNDPTASNGKYVDVAAQDSSTVKITWYFNNVGPAGNYEITFGYKLAYNTPKIQYINVNGIRIGTLTFDGPSVTTWYEKSMTVPLIHGSNNIQMQMFWGWMYVDYLALPRTVLTSVRDEMLAPTKFSLDQNYPNPFNPATVIKFSIPSSSRIKLTVYNLLGQRMATIADRYMEAGSYAINFDAAQLASGVYFYRLEAGKFISQKKMLLIR
jgi:hypothetical protein